MQLWLRVFTKSISTVTVHPKYHNFASLYDASLNLKDLFYLFDFYRVFTILIIVTKIKES
ncbi:hypothetical protein 7AX4_37 [uncultured Caudovirales phage]|uniref:Uncharacterized protein n=1 Tax=uncultured Caudovirales phage TaxID=2100421 RepID=A0A2H4JB00_9CAUD|nr:hypothetical protein 7AX4_37 [uncultured Caudovirales phage]